MGSYSNFFGSPLLNISPEVLQSGMETPAPRRTRPSNANKRLGLPDLPQKKRSPAEKKDDDERIAAVRAEKTIAAQQAVQDIAVLENHMARKQAAATAHVKPVQPQPRVVKKSRAKGSAQLTNGTYIMCYMDDSQLTSLLNDYRTCL